MSDKPGLKPCPFCGKPPEYVVFDNPDVEFPCKIYCGNHDCHWYMGTHFETEQKAVDAWNQRADLAKPSELQKHLDEAREFLKELFRDQSHESRRILLHDVTEYLNRTSTPSPPDKE